MTTPKQVVEDRFPKLRTASYGVTSPRDHKYNCVAWIARDLGRWWEPGLDGGFWPRQVAEEDLDAGDLTEYILVFESWGFRRCRSGRVVDGEEKIAIYADGEDFQHVAYQRVDGTWSSKIGKLNDIRHGRTDSLSGTGPFEYSAVQLYMTRPRQAHQLAETGLLVP